MIFGSLPYFPVAVNLVFGCSDKKCGKHLGGMANKKPEASG